MLSKAILSRKFALIFPAVLFAVDVLVLVLAPALNWEFGWPLSAVFHSLGGAAMAILFLNFWEKNPEIYSFKRKALINLILILGFVALIGVLWELYEFALDLLLKALGIIFWLQPTLTDTLMDLFWDLIGSAVIALVYFKSSLYKVPEERM